MPKLAARDRKVVENAEPTGFKPLPPGKYIATLSKVEAKTSAAGNPTWSAEFNEIHDLEGNRQPGRLWYNLNLPVDKMPANYTPRSSSKSPEEAWAIFQNISASRLKDFFEAFGYTVDSDTDEMIGEKCVLVVGVGTVQRGPRTGEETNQVNGVQPLDSVTYTEAGSAGTDDEF